MDQLNKKTSEVIKTAHPHLNLSPHDLRHFGATQLARRGATLHDLMSWGGWKSPAVAMGYIKRAEIANENVSIDD